MREQKPQEATQGTWGPAESVACLQRSNGRAPRVYKSHFFLDVYFHLVAVDKQCTVNSLYHGEHPHASQFASLIIPLDGFPGRELPSQRASRSLRHPIPSPSLALLLQPQDFFPTVSGAQGWWEGSSLLCTHGHGATSILTSQACPAV